MKNAPFWYPKVSRGEDSGETIRNLGGGMLSFLSSEGERGDLTLGTDMIFGGRCQGIGHDEKASQRSLCVPSGDPGRRERLQRGPEGSVEAGNNHSRGRMQLFFAFVGIFALKDTVG